LRLTPSGERMLKRLAAPARSAQERVLSAFDPPERAQFLRLLDKFTRRFNDSTRVPLEARRSNPPEDAAARRRGGAAPTRR
jgi:hypothetical protein